jgi:transcriptional regulator with XRE-family HTH domain
MPDATTVYVHPLRLARRAAGLTLRQLARRARVDHVKLHHAEHGRRLHDDELRRLAGVLGCQPGDLMEVGRG